MTTTRSKQTFLLRFLRLVAVLRAGKLWQDPSGLDWSDPNVGDGVLRCFGRSECMDQHIERLQE